MIDRPNAEKPLQFQLRHAGAVVVLIAITLAIAAPWLRQWSAVKWLVLLRYLGCVGVGVTIYLVAFERRYLLIRQKAGRVLTSVRTSRDAFGKLPSYLFGMMMIAILFFFGMLQVEMYEHAPESTFFNWFLLQCVIPVQLSYQACSFIRRSNMTRFYENGLLFGGVQWIDWEHLDHWKWSAADRNKLLIYAKNMQLAAIDVLPEQHDEIEAILTERTRSAKQSAESAEERSPTQVSSDAEFN